VKSILEPGDPYCQAQTEFIQELAGFTWETALEIGCGFGWHMKRVDDSFEDRRITGVDFSYQQLIQARRYLGQTGSGLVQAQASALPFQDSSFDVVFTSGTLICIQPRLLGAVLAELRRVTANHVICMEYAREHMSSTSLVRAMNRADWIGHDYTKALQAAGFQLARADVMTPFKSRPGQIPLSIFHALKG
jgi:ubiquinone/menaquinone biosynthesis C-methylase UbiE